MKLLLKEQLIDEIVIEIKRVREEKGIAQETFYNDTNIHIGRIETSSKNISIYTLYSICVYLEIKPSELFKKITG